MIIDHATRLRLFMSWSRFSRESHLYGGHQVARTGLLGAGNFRACTYQYRTCAGHFVPRFHRLQSFWERILRSRVLVETYPYVLVRPDVEIAGAEMR